MSMFNKQNAGPDLARTTTQCRLCGMQFKVSSLQIPIIGKSTDERIAALCMKLAEHIQGKHGNEAKMVAAATQTVYGMEMLGLFEHTDPLLLARMDQARRVFHRKTQGAIVSNDQIRDLAARMELDVEQTEKVVELCRALIDFATEARPDQQAPAAPSPIVEPAQVQ
jgi:hypothetical protein